MGLFSLTLCVGMFQDEDGKQLFVEVAVTLRLTTKTTSSVGMSAWVSLLYWFDLRQKLIIIIMQRPVPADDLLSYMEINGGLLK